VVNDYGKHGNVENYTNTLKGYLEAKNDMAVGHHLLKPFWGYEVIIHIKMLSYNLFLLIKFSFLYICCILAA
jgi:hypothetical protein